MSAAHGTFQPTSERDVTRLVLEYPFAWLVTAADGEFAATPLPLRPVLGEQGEVTALLGHFARRNPHVALLRRVPRTLVLFMGPHGYVSSSWLSDRTRTPTWNYATLQYVVDIEFIEGPADTNAVMNDMVETMEAGRANAWSTQEMGPRYGKLVEGIIAFRAHLRGRQAKFKFGQDERDREYGEIVQALAGNHEHTLLEWMDRANPGRRQS